MDRQQKAAEAYLSVYEGEMGIKASTEDAVLAVIRALYPFYPSGRRGIDAIRADDRLQEICEWVYEFLESASMEADEIARELVPRLDKAMLTATW